MVTLLMLLMIAMMMVTEIAAMILKRINTCDDGGVGDGDDMGSMIGMMMRMRMRMQEDDQDQDDAR